MHRLYRASLRERRWIGVRWRWRWERVSSCWKSFGVWRFECEIVNFLCCTQAVWGRLERKVEKLDRVRCISLATCALALILCSRSYTLLSLFFLVSKRSLSCLNVSRLFAKDTVQSINGYPWLCRIVKAWVWRRKYHTISLLRALRSNICKKVFRKFNFIS